MIWIFDLSKIENPIGAAFSIDGQTYTAVAIHDGIIAWKTNCPTCGAEFECRMPTKFRSPVRRCLEHRKPGTTVIAERKKRRKLANTLVEDFSP